MNIKTMRLDEINPAPYNPRKQMRPGDPGYERIRASLENYGLVEPLIFNKTTGNLVGGHQRYQILQDLGYKSAPVSIVELDQDREKALNITLNRAQGEWDQEQLDNLVKELDAAGQAEAATFNRQEIDDILLKIKVDQDREDYQEADYQALMGQAVERPDQAPSDQRVVITLRAGPEVLDTAAIKELRARWSHLGVEVDVKKGGGGH